MRTHYSKISALALIVFGLTSTFGCFSKSSLTYRLILPDEYVGWVRVDFGVDSAHPMLRWKKNHAIAEINVGDNGRAATSENMVILAPRTGYEFFYKTSHGLKPVPEDLVVHDVNAGGITAIADDYAQTIEPLSWYFFVGPQSYRLKHPNSEFLQSLSPLPRPGRIIAKK